MEAPAVSTKLRFGVLAPGSNFVPLLARDLLAALKFGFAAARLDVELVVESTGYNADAKTLIPKLQELLLTQNVAGVIAPLNVSLIEKLAAQAENMGTPLIALNLTEDPLFESARNPYLFVKSFYLWQAAWMCGYAGVKLFGTRAAYMVALHEAGYALPFAFQLGIEAAGGELVHAAVTHSNSPRDDPAPQIAAVAAQNPDFIWAGYSGKEAVSFLNAYQAMELKDRIPLIGLAPLVAPHVRQAAGAAAEGIRFVTHGTPFADENLSALTDALGRSPHPYARLGYEAAQLIAAAARECETATDFAAAFPAALRRVEINSHGITNRFDDGDPAEPDFYLWQTGGAEDSGEQLAVPPALIQQYPVACKNLAKQGWFNPYLCA